MSKNKIALICFKPNDIYLDFLNKFSNYEVYIIIDDNSVNYALLYQQKYGINNKLKIYSKDPVRSAIGVKNSG